MNQTLGILGVGHLARALVDGLMSGPFAEHARAGGLLLSPRGEQASRDLASRHGIARATDNASLVRHCEVILLATRPAQVAQALAGLPFRPEQILISVAAGVPMERLRASAPVPRRVRAMPITAAQVHSSPTALYPDEPLARAVFELLGGVIPLGSEEHFEIAATNAALYGWLFALCSEMTSWNEAQGLPPEQARALVTGTLNAAGSMLTGHPETSPQRFLEILATPGGVTELGLTVLDAGDGLVAWRAACDAVLARVRKA